MKPTGYGVDRQHDYGKVRNRVLNVRMNDVELAAVDALVAHHKASERSGAQTWSYRNAIRTRSQLIVHLVDAETARVAAELAKTEAKRENKTKRARP